ncbi:MAG: ABC transporter ATP-binding protein [Opitutales bacterium]
MADASSQRVLLALEGIRLERGPTRILRGVDWTVRSGQHWVILGPNGSGKSSLLKMLQGQEAATRGTIRLFGQTYGEADWNDLRSRIGVVASAVHNRIHFPETALETVVSGARGMINFWGRIRPGEGKAAERHLRAVGLPPRAFAGRAWGTLSQGERQRVLIARALMAGPELLILDEPCAGLDPVSRERFLHFLDGLAHRGDGPALVLVTHHVDEILPAFSHVLLLQQGRAVTAGTVREALTGPNLSRAFGAPARLRRSRDGRYSVTWSLPEYSHRKA